MKKIYALVILAVAAAACTQDVVYEIDYTVSLDKENTYKAGEPVKFNFSGSVDNIVFYSGETGHQYQYRNRYEVDGTAVKNAALDMEYQARYGDAGALEVWISNSFGGLSGTDAAADKALMKSVVDGGMEGWERLEYAEGASTIWTSQTYAVNSYMDNFCIALHWCPKDFTKTQRTYWINGAISLDLEGLEPQTVAFASLDFVSLMMNDEVEDPYLKNNGNGTIILNKPATADIIFQGIGANKLTYAIDGWVVSKPTPLNKVDNDKGQVIKNLQNYLHSFEYTWNEPGTYTVTFAGTNSNYAGSSVKNHEMTITIFEAETE